MRLTLFLLLAPLALCRAQEVYDVDSLWRVYKSSPADTNKVRLLISIGQQYENNNPDSALKIYEEALKLSTALDYKRGIISYYTNATYVYNIQGRQDTSLLLNLKSVEIARELGDPERLAACLANVGAALTGLGRPDEAIQYYLEALTFLKKTNDKQRLALMYGNLNKVYVDIHQFDKAIEVGNEGLKLSRELNNDYVTIHNLINLAVAHNSLRETDKALTLLKEARERCINAHHDYGLVTVLLNTSDAYIKRGNYSSLKAPLEEALPIARRLGDIDSEIIILRGLGIHHFNMSKPAVAESFALQSLNLATKSTSHVHMQKAFNLLAEIATLQKDFVKRHLYAEKADSLDNVIRSDEARKQIRELEAKYKSEEQLRQIDQLTLETKLAALDLQRSRLITYILIGSLLSVLIIAFLGRRGYQQRKKIFEKENELNQRKIEQLNQEKQLTAAQAMLRGQEEERTRLARDLHDGIGGLLSGVKFSFSNFQKNMILDNEHVLLFERSLNMLDHSIAELRRVAHNMMPDVLVQFGLSEALKSYCNNINQSGIMHVDFQSLHMDERLAGENEIVVYRIAQELITNALRHSGANHLVVQLSRHDNEISLTVEDNGKGMDVNANRNGSGLKNIRSRVDYLKGKIHIESSEKGTSVFIQFNQ